jgi:hypothetical protein
MMSIIFNKPLMRRGGGKEQDGLVLDQLKRLEIALYAFSLFVSFSIVVSLLRSATPSIRVHNDRPLFCL